MTEINQNNDIISQESNSIVRKCVEFEKEREKLSKELAEAREEKEKMSSK